MDNRKKNQVDKENNELECSETSLDMDYLGNGNLVFHGNHNNNRGMCHSVSMPEYSGGSLTKWRLSGLRPDREKRYSSIFRNSLHWEEFFGK